MTSGLAIVGTLVHLLGRALATRSAGDRSSLIVSAIGAGLVIVAAGLSIAGIAPETRSGQLTVALWLLGGGMGMLTTLAFRSAAVGVWGPLAISLASAGAVIGGVWLGEVDPRAAVDIFPASHTAWSAANTACLAGGLALTALGLLSASDDERLHDVTWTCLALVAAGAIGAVIIGTGNGTFGSGAFFALSTSDGVTIDVRAVIASGPEAESISVPALHVAGASERAIFLIVALGLSIAAAIVATRRHPLTRWLFGVAALGALFASWQIARSAGVVTSPTESEMTSILVMSGVNPDLILGTPELSTGGPYEVHRADVLGPLMGLWFAAALLGVRAVSPMVVAPRGPGFPFSRSLVASRDALLLATILLWAGIALGLLGTLEATDRLAPNQHVAAYLALGFVAAAGVSAWSGASQRASRAAAGAWLGFPTALLILAAAVMLSGGFTESPFTFTSVAP